ncbi:MAG: adenylate/guanylate cyclase domain-containing protein [Alphaproteobacteria bacterium]|nr:adenylate/guanylate cyclase domain-containing protein [Alphaproteobacteria bacterium]
MADDAMSMPLWERLRTRRGGLREEEFARADPYVREALSENKHTGLVMAVRARWIALAVIAVLIPFLNPRWEVLYYEVALIGFALIGWAQLRTGRVALSRPELLLIFCDLALMTFLLVVPNPFRDEVWPTAFQYHLSDFSYFYVLLAAGALAYSWRTIFAFAAWTTCLWLLALIPVALFGAEIPALSAAAAAAFAGHERILEVFDPNDPVVPARIQEVVVFLIVAAILGVNGRLNNQLVFRQAEIARERGNLARHFPPTIVDRMAEQDQPLGAVRSQDVAVMFVDIVGFTRMAERQTPEEVVALLRQFHGRLEVLVFEHQGTLDKFLGDGLMATFGTPEPGPVDAANALRCGRDILADIGEWNRERQAAGAAPIEVSVGLHHGPVVLGDIGSERRLEYAVLGDTVNVAYRLEALTRDLGVGMAVSDALVAAVRGEVGTDGETMLSALDRSGSQSLRGRDEPIEVWTC